MTACVFCVFVLIFFFSFNVDVHGLSQMHSNPLNFHNGLLKTKVPQQN